MTEPPCPRCRAAQNKWRDSKPSKVLPTFGIAYGSGAPSDITIAAIRGRARNRYERWRTLVRESVAQIARGCRAQGHVTEPDDRDEVWGADDFETAADTEADEFPPYVITEHAFAERGLL